MELLKWVSVELLKWVSTLTFEDPELGQREGTAPIVFWALEPKQLGVIPTNLVSDYVFVWYKFVIF